MINTDLEPTLPEALPTDPLHEAERWLQTATDHKVQRNPNAMTLVTVAASGQPSARIVLCKSLVPDPGYLVFYTNYESRKAVDLASDRRCAAVFHWDALGRQVRLEGIAVRSPADESDDYFATRNWGSKLGAWGSQQSQPLASRQQLITQLHRKAKDLGLRVSDDLQELRDADDVEISRPPHWGGFRLWPESIELWIEGADRIHERACWKRQLRANGSDSFDASDWQGERLQP